MEKYAFFRLYFVILQRFMEESYHWQGDELLEYPGNGKLTKKKKKKDSLY